MFFLLLTEDDSIIGADYRQFALPQFNLEELDGSSFITSSDLGDTYIINVWASWCITCRVEHPFLEEISKTIPIIGLNYKDEKNNATEWLNKLGDPYIFSLYDYYGELALDLGVTGAPETFLVYKGRIISHHVGEVDQKVWSTKFLSTINKINND